MSTRIGAIIAVLLTALAITGPAQGVTAATQFDIHSDGNAYEWWTASGVVNVSEAQYIGYNEDYRPTGRVEIMPTDIAEWNIINDWDVTLTKIKNTATQSYITGRIKFHLHANTITPVTSEDLSYAGSFRVLWAGGVYAGLKGRGSMSGHHTVDHNSTGFTLRGTLTRP